MPTHFSQDRDLVIYEPALLRDVAWAGQRRLSTTGSITGSTLTIAAGSFESAGVEPGHTALVNGVTLEIVSIDSPTTATVSLIRAVAAASPVPPMSVTGVSVQVHDFSPQRAVVHRQILAMLGLGAEGETDHGLDETAITNPRALARLECLGTLHLIYAGAAAPGRPGAAVDSRVAMYQDRYRAERESVVAMIDTDADGIAEATRRPNAFVLTRA